MIRYVRIYRTWRIEVKASRWRSLRSALAIMRHDLHSLMPWSSYRRARRGIKHMIREGREDELRESMERIFKS